MSGLKNYGAMRGGTPREFLIGVETFLISKYPAQVHLDFLAWRANLLLPVSPKNPDDQDPEVDYREDMRTQFDLLFDLTILTLNSARTQDQKNRFEVTRSWITDDNSGVSGDMLDEFVYDVMGPFLDRLTEKEQAEERKTAEKWQTMLEPMLIAMVKTEIEKTMMSKPTRTRTSTKSAPLSESSAIQTDGPNSIV